jgi:hypothetical protein
MRTIIAGSRDITNYDVLLQAITKCGWVPTVVISGTARGADKLGEYFAAEFGLPCEKYPADWDKFGKSAGYKRNEQMAEVAEAVIALWDGESHGTKHMIDIATKKGLRVYVHIVGK